MEKHGKYTYEEAYGITRQYMGSIYRMMDWESFARENKLSGELVYPDKHFKGKGWSGTHEWLFGKTFDINKVDIGVVNIMTCKNGEVEKTADEEDREKAFEAIMAHLESDACNIVELKEEKHRDGIVKEAFFNYDKEGTWKSARSFADRESGWKLMSKYLWEHKDDVVLSEEDRVEVIKGIFDELGGIMHCSCPMLFGRSKGQENEEVCGYCRKHRRGCLSCLAGETCSDSCRYGNR